MDKGQSEVTDKIRHSIKEKLKKMNTFVDDELPDYIMILIANKRNKHQMEKDLSLFLGNQTEEFTNWLWDLVSAFKGGSKTKNSKSSLNLDSQGAENIQTKEIRAEEDDVLSYDPTEEGDSLFFDEKNESSTKQQISAKADDSKQQLSSDDESPANSNLLLSAADKPKRKTFIKQEVKDTDPVEVAVPKAVPGKQKSAKVYPMQRIKQSPSITQERASTATSSEVSKAEYSGVASVVCFTQRKFAGAAAALQANKLLLKAVNDATKSVLKGRDINEYYKPTPIKELAESNKNKEECHQRIPVPRNSVEDIINEQDNRLVKCEVHDPIIESSKVSRQILPRHIVSLNSDTGAPEQVMPRHVVSSEIDISEQIMPRHVVDLNSEIDMSETPKKVYANIHQSQVQIEEENSVTPHFIVTLDGVDFASLKRKRSIVSDDEPMDIDEDFDDKLATQVQEKKLKIAERCKYWPACKNNGSCAYHHPTVPCKSFPKCKFGDKCLYIHPNCKFDALCSKRDCPFTHCSVRKYPMIPTAVIKPVKIQKSKSICKYYPHCTAKPCPFIHPKLCRFGTQCRSPTCRFSHFQVPDPHQLKWKAA